MLERFTVTFGIGRRSVGMFASGVLACGAAVAVGGCNTPMTYPDGGVDSSVVTDSSTDTNMVHTNPPDTNPPDTNSLDTNPSDMGVDSGVVLHARTTATNGSAIVLNSDDSVLVACNRQAGSVSIFSVTPGAAGAAPTLGTPHELTFAGDEPWAAVIGNDDDTAYVILRRAQQVVRIDHLRTTPTVAATRGTTGSEPTGIAISPAGTMLYVANWGEGTASAFATSNIATAAMTIDLNASLAATGSLGAGVTSRPGLAHPRAIVVTNDQDTNDANDTVYVTEFFGQTRTDTLPADDSRFDLERNGLVYRFNSGTGATAAPITLAPTANTGFADTNGTATGCYANQLFAATINNARLYVTAVCVSPRGPVNVIATATPTFANVKTQVHASIYVVDIATNAELPAQGLRLTQQFQTLYDGPTPATPTTPDDNTRRIPLIPNDLAFVPGSSVAYLPGYGSDAVFRVAYNPDGTLGRVGSPGALFMNLGVAPNLGRLPYGIAIGNSAAGAAGYAFVVSEHSRSIVLLQLSTQTVLSATQSTALPTAASPAANALDGRRFFVTGTGRWSFRGQAWNSCENCHSEGLTDNVTWYFGRGPRQSISLDGSFDSTDPTQQRIFNWTAIFDEIGDFENNTRGNSGGLGAVVHANPMPPSAADRIIFDGTALAGGQVASTNLDNGLNGSVNNELLMGGTNPDPNAMAISVLPDWLRVQAYVQSIRSPRGPVGLAAADVAAGATIFAMNNCASCHGTSMWTTSRRFWTPDEAHNNPATGSLRLTAYTAAAAFPAALNPPSMGVGRMAMLRLPGGTAATDQIQCVLRAVGTFPAAGTMPVLPTGSTVQLSEVRQDMAVTAQGSTGFNSPSLLNGVAGAPYFHGGNARTLEEVFSPTFAAHYQALSVNFMPTATQIRQLVAYLLSIDESTAMVAPPTLTFDTRLCPASF